MSNILKFSELLITRFCHDIAGPVGAVQNGLEFLDENISEEMNSKAMEIIGENSKELTIKLKFFRYIYGRSSVDGEVDLHTVSELAEPYFACKKTTFKIQNDSDGMEYLQVTQKASKLILLLAYAASDCLIVGGDINVEVARNSGHKSINITCKSNKFKRIEELEEILTQDKKPELKLSNIHYYLVWQIATELGVNVAVDCGADFINLAINFN